MWDHLLARQLNAEQDVIGVIVMIITVIFTGLFVLYALWHDIFGYHRRRHEDDPLED